MPLRDASLSLTLIEDAVIGVRDLLRAQLNPNIQMVWEATADRTINMELVPDSRYYISEAIEPLQPPAIFVIADASTFELEWQQGNVQKHDIIVAALVDDIEVTRLTKKVWRYARAIQATLHDRAVGQIHVLVRSVNYGPVLARPSGQSRAFRKDVSLRCEVLHFEA